MEASLEKVESQAREAEEALTYDYTLSSNPQEKWRVELGADLYKNNGWISHISYEIGKNQQGADKYKLLSATTELSF